jgi:hypothetical protein
MKENNVMQANIVVRKIQTLQENVILKKIVS